MHLLVSPHADDETLFAAYTIIRLKPLVLIVTDDDRTPEIAHIRREESRQAMKILGADVKFLGVKESQFTPMSLNEFDFECDLLFTPAIQGGHIHHDQVGRYFKSGSIHYATYTKQSLIPYGNVEVIPTKEEMDIKNRALDCYKSQMNNGHFEHVRNRSEFYVM